MTKHYRIHVRGKQREDIDADLMARLVIWFGREMADDARQAILAQADANPRAELNQSTQAVVKNRTNGAGSGEDA